VIQVVADGDPGGGTTSVLSLSEGLRDRGLDVSLASQTDSHALLEADRLGLRTIALDLFSVGRLTSALAGLRRTVARLQPDLVHLHGGRAGALGTLALARGRRYPLVYTVRGYHFVGRRALARHLGAWVHRWTHRRVDVTVWVSNEDRALAMDRRLEAGRGLVIRNGIGLGSLPAPDDFVPKSVACLGRITAEKNPFLLLRIAEKLRAEGFVFTMIGGGDLETDVRRRIEDMGLGDSVLVTGALPRESALRTLRTAETLILPSRWEGLPIAPLEAMAMGIPPVVSRVRGNVEVVTDGVDGLVVDLDDEDGFVTALRRLSQESGLRSRLAVGGQETVKRDFSLERVLDEHVKLYMSLWSGVETSKTGRKAPDTVRRVSS